jgi:hypothetical protein
LGWLIVYLMGSRSHLLSMQESIKMALTTILDLSEQEVCEVLAFVVTHHRRNQVSMSDPTAMQVDNTGMPPLPQFLHLCTGSSAAPANLRLALRHVFTDVEDVICLLQVAEDWISSFEENPPNLFPGSDQLTTNAHGAKIVRPEALAFDRPTERSPPFQNVSIGPNMRVLR